MARRITVMVRIDDILYRPLVKLGKRAKAKSTTKYVNQVLARHVKKQLEAEDVA